MSTYNQKYSMFSSLSGKSGECGQWMLTTRHADAWHQLFGWYGYGGVGSGVTMSLTP